MNPSQRLSSDGNKAMLAEFGSLSLEFRALSRHTGDPSYAQLVDRIYDFLAAFNATDGLYPLIISCPAEMDTFTPLRPRHQRVPREFVRIGRAGRQFLRVFVEGLAAGRQARNRGNWRSG